MTSDVAEARPLSPGSGEERRILDHVAEKRAGVPSSARAAEPVAPDRRLGTLDGVRVQRDLGELSPAWLELDVWLARSLLRYAARNFSIENTVPRDSM
jgi:hypothetical protein